MSISAGIGEVIRQLLIANEQTSDSWKFRVFVQNKFSDRDIPPGLNNAIFTKIRGKYILPILQIWRSSKRSNADRAVATDFRLFIIALFAWTLRFRSPREVTFWIHGIPLVIDGTVKRLIFRVLSVASPLIFVSEAVRNEHEYPWHMGRKRIVYNAVQDHGFRASSIGSRNPIVLQYTAAFVGWKNHRTLLHAIAKVIQSGVMIDLRLLGEGQLKKEMELLAKDLGIDSHVQFMGRRSDARELLQECDLYVHSSLGEALGVAVVEAMFARLPIITSDSGAFPEYLEHESSALLVNCKDNGQELSEAILEMIKRIEDGRATVMANNAKFSAKKQFGLSRYISEWREAVHG